MIRGNNYMYNNCSKFGFCSMGLPAQPIYSIRFTKGTPAVTNALLVIPKQTDALQVIPAQSFSQEQILRKIKYLRQQNVENPTNSDKKINSIFGFCFAMAYYSMPIYLISETLGI